MLNIIQVVQHVTLCTYNGELIMKTLYMITGATGHLGNTITRQLMSTGQEVRILALPDDKDIPHCTQVCYGDVTDIASLHQFFNCNGYDKKILIHCAAIISINDKADDKVSAVNVGGTINIVDMAIQYNIDKMIHVSSVHAIAEPIDNSAICETDTFCPQLVVGCYAKTKAAATAYVLAMSHKLNVCVVHPSGIIGPYDNKSGNLTKLIQDYATNKQRIGINGGYDFVDVRDVANGIINCCQLGVRGNCYILSGNYYSVKHIYNTIDNYLGRKRKPLIISRDFAKLIAPISQLFAKILRRRTSFTTYSVYTLGAKSNFCHDKASQHLYYATRPLTDTITDTIPWIKLLAPRNSKATKLSTSNR